MGGYKGGTGTAPVALKSPGTNLGWETRGTNLELAWGLIMRLY